MKRKAYFCVGLLCVLSLGIMSGCGQKAANDNSASPGGESAEGASAETGAAADAKNQTSSESTSSSSPDGLLGEWEYIYSTYHTDDSDGYVYDDVTMCTDEGAPDTRVIIRKDGDKYLMDYKYNEYEYYAVIYGAELTYSDKPAYEGAENKSWSMELQYPFEEDAGEDGGTWKKVSLTEDGMLVVSDEHTGSGDDEYNYSSLNTDVYLRKEAPELEDKDSLRYFDTVTVSTAAELLNSVKSNRKILLESGVYNFSRVSKSAIDNKSIGDNFGAYKIDNVSNICLEAKEGADVQFVIEDPYAAVLTFSGGRNITVSGITVGHDVEPGYCSGSVLHFENANGIRVEKCHLYGSGTYGIEASSCYGVAVNDTEIYECTYGLLSLYEVGDVVFNNCTMRDSKELSMISCNSAYDVAFENCTFSGNRADAFDSCYFVELGEYDRISFRNSSFKDNIYKAFSNREVTLENCTSEGNKSTYGDMLSEQQKSSPLTKDDIVANYNSTLKRQEEIDNKLQSDTLLDQLSLNDLAYEEYNIWDTLLNQIWTYLTENLDEDAMNKLREDQKKWIREKETSMKEAGAGFEGGSMQPMVEYGDGAAATQKRVEELMKQYIN